MHRLAHGHVVIHTVKFLAWSLKKCWTNQPALSETMPRHSLMLSWARNTSSQAIWMQLLQFETKENFSVQK